METITLNAAAALASGLIAGLSTLFLMLGLLATRPHRFPLNPLYLSGSMLTVDTTLAYLAGLVTTLIVSAGYGIVLAAVFVGFQQDALLPLWGALAGAALSIVTGTTLAYLRILNPAVRRGLVGDPGPFLLRYGAWSIAQLVAAHVIFGLMTGAIYQLMA